MGDYKDWLTKVEYIRANPVRARFVQKPGDWPYSSASGELATERIPVTRLEWRSGGKAKNASALMSELELRPPKEENLTATLIRSATL